MGLLFLLTSQVKLCVFLEYRILKIHHPPPKMVANNSCFQVTAAFGDEFLSIYLNKAVYS
jgi:hypothetical protein